MIWIEALILAASITIIWTLFLSKQIYAVVKLLELTANQLAEASASLRGILHYIRIVSDHTPRIAEPFEDDRIAQHRDHPEI